MKVTVLLDVTVRYLCVAIHSDPVWLAVVIEFANDNIAPVSEQKLMFLLVLKITL